ncbi:hypothetical protein E2C01_095797 [Portunus trituberculatus]|uniref:Uncharacterized protein n=1 Tax=Portunus trituberculatus TaxID=210409 RepID=A0A5B7JTY2_PORTR|nr:hypothetical protein [Portunus trituberculatus]
MYLLIFISLLHVAFRSACLQTNKSLIDCSSLQGLSNPHDVVVSPDGREVYVAEIGPNNVWRFVNEDGSPPRKAPTPSLFQRITNFLTSILNMF